MYYVMVLNDYYRKGVPSYPLRIATCTGHGYAFSTGRKVLFPVHLHNDTVIFLLPHPMTKSLTHANLLVFGRVLCPK